MTYAAFVSYNRRETRWAEEFCEHLATEGIEHWVDFKQIQEGDPTWDTIERGISGSKTLVCVVTPRTLAREYVKKECYCALFNAKIPLIPLMIEYVDNEEYRLVFGDALFVNLYQDNSNACRAAYHRLLKRLGAQNGYLPDPPDYTSEGRDSKVPLKVQRDYGKTPPDLRSLSTEALLQELARRIEEEKRLAEAKTD